LHQPTFPFPFTTGSGWVRSIRCSSTVVVQSRAQNIIIQRLRTMHIADMEGPLKVLPKAGINILVDYINPCGHANSIHRDRVFLALSTRYGPHNKM
jgi:hypothetical protein